MWVNSRRVPLLYSRVDWMPPTYLPYVHHVCIRRCDRGKYLPRYLLGKCMLNTQYVSPEVPSTVLGSISLPTSKYSALYLSPALPRLTPMGKLFALLKIDRYLSIYLESDMGCHCGGGVLILRNLFLVNSFLERHG